MAIHPLKTLLTVVLLVLGGCTYLPQDHPDMMQFAPRADQALVMTGSLRSAYFLSNSQSGTVQFCAEPAPDVALATQQKTALALKANILEKGDADGSISNELISSVTALAGRTQVVLVGRDFLYRLCELSVNKNLSSSEAASLYGEAAKLVIAIARTAEAEAKTDQAKAETQLLEKRRQMREQVSPYMESLNAKIAAIVAKFTDTKSGAVKSDALDKFITDSGVKMSASVRRRIVGSRSSSALTNSLLDEGEDYVDPLFQKLPK